MKKLLGASSSPAAIPTGSGGGKINENDRQERRKEQKRLEEVMKGTARDPNEGKIVDNHLFKDKKKYGGLLAEQVDDDKKRADANRHGPVQQLTHSNMLILLPCIEYSQYMVETPKEEQKNWIWGNCSMKDIVEQDSGRWQTVAAAYSIEQAATRRTRGKAHLKARKQDQFFDHVGFFPTDFFCYWGEPQLDKKFNSSDNVNTMYKARKDTIPEMVKMRRGIPLPVMGFVMSQRSDLVSRLQYWSPNRVDGMNWGGSRNDAESFLMNRGNLMFYALEGYKAEKESRKTAPPNPLSTDETFKEVLLGLGNPNYYAVIGYYRSELKQGPGFATAVLGGYDPKRDMVLILDSAKTSFPMHWAPAKTVRKAICMKFPRGCSIVDERELTACGLIEIFVQGALLGATGKK